MAFIRRRLSGKEDDGYEFYESYSYQILESYRVGTKVKQRVLYNMGPSPTIEAALAVQEKALVYYEESLASTLKYLDTPRSERFFNRTDAENNQSADRYRRFIQRTKQNITFLKTVVVSTPQRWEPDTTWQAFYEEQLHAHRRYERLGVVSSAPRVRLDTTEEAGPSH